MGHDRREIALRTLGIAAAAGLALVIATACIPDVVPNQTTLPRCDGLDAGCGKDSKEDCCATGDRLLGGTFTMFDDNDAASITKVADFQLDRFEVTVGRFRKFVESYPGNKPLAGAGKHPLIAKSGWDPAWDDKLPVDQKALVKSLGCNTNFRTWTDAPSDTEGTPINCVTWYVAFAFCAWDGGRLATEAEWNFAAAGGDEQRTYPWGDDAPDAAYASFDCKGGTAAECILRVGSTPPGDGKWMQADLAGSMVEWTLDHHVELPSLCDNCAKLDGGGQPREGRGGDFVHGADQLATRHRIGFDPAVAEDFIGLRCARDL